ncbi:MAG: general secretion pathway protein GspB [Lysobacterales bacterium]
MSLILDALKKSEAQRRLGQAPGLSSAFSPAPRRERGPLLWSFLLLLVVSTAALWHNRALLGGADPASDALADADTRTNHAQALNGKPQAAAQADSDRPAPAATTAPAGSRASSVPTHTASLPMPRPQSLPTPAADDDPLAGVSAQHREQIENGTLVVPHPQILAQRGATRDPQIVTAEAALPPTIEAPAAVETEDGRLVYPSESATNPTPGAAATAAPAPPASATPAIVPSATSPAPDTVDGSPTAAVAASLPSASTRGVPLIYDLTLGQRQGLPELKMSMHVYHRDVARRFAIIDGRRLNEGDPIGQLLWAREIVPEGVIIEYRDLRFLLPRPGG